jgi:chromosomal replication initiator protein
MSVETIKLTVAAHFGITLAEMDSRRRPDRIAWPRQIAMQLVRERMRLGVELIGNKFDRSDSNVCKACQQVKNRIAIYPSDRANYEQIRYKLGLTPSPMR